MENTVSTNARFVILKAEGMTEEIEVSEDLAEYAKTGHKNALIEQKETRRHQKMIKLSFLQYLYNAFCKIERNG